MLHHPTLQPVWLVTLMVGVSYVRRTCFFIHGIAWAAHCMGSHHTAWDDNDAGISHKGDITQGDYHTRWIHLCTQLLHSIMGPPEAGT